MHQICPSQALGTRGAFDVELGPVTMPARRNRIFWLTILRTASQIHPVTIFDAMHMESKQKLFFFLFSLLILVSTLFRAQHLGSPPWPSP